MAENDKRTTVEENPSSVSENITTSGAVKHARPGELESEQTKKAKTSGEDVFAKKRAYLNDLQAEKQKLTPFQSTVPLTLLLLDREIRSVEAELGSQNSIPVSSSSPSPAISSSTSPFPSSETKPSRSAKRRSAQIDGPSALSSSFSTALSLSPSSSEASRSENHESFPDFSQLPQTISVQPQTSPSVSTQEQKLSEKIFVEPEKHPNFNFVGRLLGPRGLTLKRLESESDCKVLIRGQGSIKAKEKELRDKPGYEHLKDPLHVIIEAEGANAAEKLAKARALVLKLLEPVSDNDTLKQSQLRELALLKQQNEPAPQPVTQRARKDSVATYSSPSPANFADHAPPGAFPYNVSIPYADPGPPPFAYIPPPLSPGSYIPPPHSPHSHPFVVPAYPPGLSFENNVPVIVPPPSYMPPPPPYPSNYRPPLYPSTTYPSSPPGHVPAPSYSAYPDRANVTQKRPRPY